MFDSLWLQEVLNDMYETGLQNDNLVLLFEENRKNMVSIKTPYGKTKPILLEEIVMQGTVFGPLQCAVSMDKLGKKAYKSGKPLLKYKNRVYIPPLGMIDR